MKRDQVGSARRHHPGNDKVRETRRRTHQQHSFYAVDSQGNVLAWGSQNLEELQEEIVYERSCNWIDRWSCCHSIPLRERATCTVEPRCGKEAW